MNFAKTRPCFATVAAFAACLASSSAFAAIIAQEGFETSRASFVADDSTIDASTTVVYTNNAPGVAAEYPFDIAGYGSKYLAVDTDETTIWNTFSTRASSTYFDSWVKLTPFNGEMEFPAASKFLVFLDGTTSNICVVSGTAADNHTPITNALTSAGTVVPDSWHRLTVNAIPTDGVFAFQVRLDGTLLSTAGGTHTFYSLTADSTMSHVGISGTGAIDNFVVRSTDPFIADEDKAATIGSESYASLEDALEEANGATITLDADHAGTVAVTKSGTYTIDKGAHTFGGVVGTEGSYVTSSTSGNVDTYTVKLLVALWDGDTAAYDFSTLTRTLGDNTYTLNLNPVGSANTVAADSSYIQIADNDAQCGVTITTQNSNPAETNGFGTSGTVTVLMKCRDMPVTAANNRAIISLMDGKKYKYGGTSQQDNGAVLGMYIVNGTSGWIWRGSTAGMAGLSGNFLNTVSGKFSADEQVVALTYSNSGGTCYYVNGELAQSESGLKDSTGLARPYGIALGGVDVSTGSQFFALKNMKIEAIAVFSSTLTADEVASYTFPSETPMSGTVAVSDINALFGTKSDITVRLVDGTTVTGDTTFNASSINFVCDGSFTMTAPAGNTATFDFSEVTGNPVFVYNGVTPSVSGNTFTSSSIPTWVTDSSQWTGTVWIKNKTITNFIPSNFGNADSTLRLSGISVYFPNQATPLVLNPAIELVNDAYNYGLYVSDGFSRDASNQGRYITFSKLKGDGELWTGNNAPNVLMNILDWSDFSGKIQLVNKIVVFGSAVPAIADFNTSGSIYIPSGVTVTVPDGKQWRADGGVHVYGTFNATDIGENQLKDTTSVITYDAGTFVLTSTSNGQESETDTSYARITGTGTLKYEGTGWRALSASNFPTNMTLMNEQAGDILLSRAQTYTIGSFAGSKNLQGNYGSGDRYLRILQAKDTTWSGKITEDGYSRLKGLTVAPGESTAGTLTLSGTQTQSAALTVEAGAMVNLTGTWKGATSVAGTLYGTGTITGDLTLSDGATLDFANLGDLLEVSGNLTTAAGTVTIRVPAGTKKGTKFIGVTGTVTIDPSTRFEIYVGGERKGYLNVKPITGGVKVTCPGVQARFF